MNESSNLGRTPDPDPTRADDERAKLYQLATMNRYELAAFYKARHGLDPLEIEPDISAAELRHALTSPEPLQFGPCVRCGGGALDWRHHGTGEARHTYEPAQPIDPGDQCAMCNDPDCTAAFRNGEPCGAEFDHGAIMPSGLVRPVQMQPADAGGWLIKPVPGQVVGDFTEEAEATRAAASWNACASLTLEQVRELERLLEGRDPITVLELIADSKGGTQ